MPPQSTFWDRVGVHPTYLVHYLANAYQDIKAHEKLFLWAKLAPAPGLASSGTSGVSVL